MQSVRGRAPSVLSAEGAPRPGAAARACMPPPRVCAHNGSRQPNARAPPSASLYASIAAPPPPPAAALPRAPVRVLLTCTLYIYS